MEILPISIVSHRDLGRLTITTGMPSKTIELYRTVWVLSDGREIICDIDAELVDAMESPALYRYDNDNIALCNAGVPSEAIEQYDITFGNSLGN